MHCSAAIGVCTGFLHCWEQVAREKVEMQQMQHAAEILRDEFGVPHIYAET